MKEIKTRPKGKSIKQLDRAAHVLERAKHAAITKHATMRDKREGGDDEYTASSTATYAEQRSIVAVSTMGRAQMEMGAYISKRWLRWQLNKRTKQDGRTVAPRAVVHSFRLHKPINGQYRLPMAQKSGKQRWIQGRVHARLQPSTHPHSPSTNKMPNRGVNSGIHRQASVGKRAIHTTIPFAARNIRGKSHQAIPPASLKSQLFKGRKSTVVSATSRQNKPTIKQKGQMLKSVSRVMRTGLQPKQMNERSDAQTEGKRLAVKTAQQAAQMAIAARRSVQMTRATMRLQIRIIQMVAKATALLVKGLAVLLGSSSVVIILLCMVMAIVAITSSPFGIFVSGENKGADVQPLSHIVQALDEELAMRLEDIRQSVGVIDRVELNYPGSADNTRIDNWADVIAIFAVKTVLDEENGMDVATLDATRTEMIHSVFWEMNQVESQVETIEHQETVTVTHEDGNTSEETTIRYEYILHITITSRTAEQQANEYNFTDEQIDLMKEMMSAEFRPFMFALLGKDTDIGLTPEQLKWVTRELPVGEQGSEVVNLALTRLGDPYSQPKAGQDDYTDCSYLVQWVYRQLGIHLPRTAAEQARYSVENGLVVSAADLVPGDLVLWSYERNGRFMDITHVGIYAGDGKVVDASSTRGQVVYRNLFDADKQVLFGRPHLTSNGE
ncbi:C40 family peptidase [Paenibacillus sp. J5C_2022]|uniref:C40 family peptidase n=1 Tax=Paenibacillus sp. J5C2022 TaxID=2977129 RepID=UPI0021D2BED4|nr:C40 family peptidase [Paenibacillus sp. J5C2022]MCU6711554.1 C40 family peptidase [Paenibacillus sp. J5C2022]